MFFFSAEFGARDRGLFALVLCVTALLGAPAAVLAQPELSGDLRLFWANSWRDTRAGEAQPRSDLPGGRFRLRLRTELNERWRFQTRFATTFEEEGNDPQLFFRSNRQSGTAVDPGSATLDEVFFRYRDASGDSELILGRFQSTLRLPLFTNRSLDRNQASNINIGWTDGIQYRRRLGGGWDGLTIVQYNGRDGNGSVTRSPLDFSDSSSRISGYVTLLNEQAWGPVIQRAVALTWYPDALASDGIDTPRRQDYLTLTARMAAAWDLGERARLIVGGEVGHSLNTQSKSVARLAGAGDADGYGWLIGADIDQIFPSHRMGISLGRADAGWLISNDVRPNDTLAEFRWQYYATTNLRFEFRARWRYEQKRRVGAEFLQRDRDMRVRMTLNF